MSSSASSSSGFPVSSSSSSSTISAQVNVGAAAEEEKKTLDSPVALIYDDISADAATDGKGHVYHLYADEFVQFVSGASPVEMFAGFQEGTQRAIIANRPIHLIAFSKFENMLSSHTVDRYLEMPVIRIFVAFSFVRSETKIYADPGSHARILEAYRQSIKSLNVDTSADEHAKPINVALVNTSMHRFDKVDLANFGSARFMRNCGIDPSNWARVVFFRNDYPEDAGGFNRRCLRDIFYRHYIAATNDSVRMLDAAATLNAVVTLGLDRRRKRREGEDAVDSPWSVFLSRGLYDPRILQQIYFLVNPTYNDS